MPWLGPGVDEGLIVEWLVPDGSYVRAGQTVVVVEGDRGLGSHVESTVQVSFDGVLGILVPADSKLPAGQIIALVYATHEVGDHETAFRQRDRTDSIAPVDSPPDAVPDMAAQAPTAEESPSGGPHTARPVDADQAIGEPPALVGLESHAQTDDRPKPDPPRAEIFEPTQVEADPQAHDRLEATRIAASPRARAVARSAKVDLARIQGTGPNGRVVEADVEAAIARQVAQDEPDLEPSAPSIPPVLTPHPIPDPRDSELANSEPRDAGLRDSDHGDTELGNSGPQNAGPLISGTLISGTLNSEPQNPGLEDSDQEPVSASTAARLLAEFVGVDLAEIPHPPDGRHITREDVGAWIRFRLGETSDKPRPAAETVRVDTTGTVVASAAASVADSAAQGEAELSHEQVETEPRSWRPSRGPTQATLSIDVDIGPINLERTRRLEARSTVPGYTAWVVSASAQAMAEHPLVNSQMLASDDGEYPAAVPDVHVGVAIALESGMVVPVIEHADLRPVEEIHELVADFAARAKLGLVEESELVGATFSVTALGMFGVDMFTPIIEPPNTAILGLGRVRSETVWQDGEPFERKAMTLSLTWDTRGLDAPRAAEFAETIVKLLQTPAELV